MFGRWLRRKDSSGPSIALPNLDDQVTAHWNRGAASPPPPANAPADSLDFVPTPGSHTSKTKEHQRRRRRLLWSLLAGLVVGPFLAAPVICLIYLLMGDGSAVTTVVGSLGERITFGPDDQEEILHSSDISPDEARKLGDVLQHEGIFDGREAKSVRLSKDGDVYVVGFALEWGSWRNKDVVADFRDLLPRLSRGAFNGRAVEIHLCARQADSKDRAMPTMRVIRADVER